MIDYFKNLPAEEKANTWTHLVPWVAAIIYSVPMLQLAYHQQMICPKHQLLGTILFLIGTMLM